jgi:hypothetical protein
VVVSTAVNGSALNVTVTATSVGNAVRFVQTGSAAGTTVNAAPIFTSATSESSGTKTFVPQSVAVTTVFQVQRQSAGGYSTLPFMVTDGCGSWKSLAGGGPGAGF